MSNPTPSASPKLALIAQKQAPDALAVARAKARKITWMFFDVDGVMTDGGLFYNAEGESLKRFNVLDGHGLKALKSVGIRLGLISGRSHPATAARAAELGFDVVVQGDSEKGAVFDRIAESMQLDPSLCGHMGDDTPDLQVFSRVGFAAAVSNAVPDVIQAAHWVSTCAGGDGAVRECCEFILESRT